MAKKREVSEEILPGRFSVNPSLTPLPTNGPWGHQTVKRWEAYLQRQDMVCTRGDSTSRISDKILTSRKLGQGHESDVLGFSPGFITQLCHFKQVIYPWSLSLFIRNGDKNICLRVVLRINEIIYIKHHVQCLTRRRV